MRLWTTRVRVCDGNAMNVRCVFLGAPENLGFLGRAGALVARRFSGAVSAIATQVPNASAKVRRTFWVLQIFFEKNEKK